MYIWFMYIKLIKLRTCPDDTCTRYLRSLLEGHDFPPLFQEVGTERKLETEGEHKASRSSWKIAEPVVSLGDFRYSSTHRTNVEDN